MRPVLVDINQSQAAPRLSAEVSAIPLRVRLMAALPLINLITGLVVAAFTSGGGGGAALGLDVLVAVAVATTISLELTVLFAKSILRPIADLQRATEARARGALRRLGAGDDRGRARRAGRLVQPDGPGPGRARAAARGVRHLPRQVGRRVHPQRGIRGGGGGARGLGAGLRRPRLHRVRPAGGGQGGGGAAQRAVRDRGPDRHPPRRPRRQVRRATECWRCSACPRPTRTTPTARCAPPARSRPG